jgi:hypothetical protein
MNEWNNDQEIVLEGIRENALQMKRSNTKLYLSLKGQLARYKIPIIIISALNSVFSVGAERYLPQHYISGISCLLSLVVGIIGSLQMYLQIEGNMEICLVSSRDYYNLAIEIYKTLTLERQHRQNNGKEYLEEVYNRYVAITNKTIVNKKKIVDRLFTSPALSENVELRNSIPYIPTPASSADLEASSDEMNV